MMLDRLPEVDSVEVEAPLFSYSNDLISNEAALSMQL